MDQNLLNVMEIVNCIQQSFNTKFNIHCIRIIVTATRINSALFSRCFKSNFVFAPFVRSNVTEIQQWIINERGLYVHGICTRPFLVVEC